MGNKIIIRIGKKGLLIIVIIIDQYAANRLIL